MADHIKSALAVAKSRIDRDASRADANPTIKQKEAGNYSKGHVRLHGMDISIENPKGSHRRGIDANGNEWRSTIPSHYGYIKGTKGHDGDHVDVYIGPDHHSGKVYVVDQIDAKTKAFDEHKCMMSYGSKDAAIKDYQKAFSDGKGADRIGAITEMTVPEFKSWLASGDTKRPLGMASGGHTTTIASRHNSEDISMPLVQGSSRNAVSQNIRTERGAGKPADQAVAIALNVARNARKTKSQRRGYADGGIPELPVAIDPVDRVLDDDVLPLIKSRLSRQRPDQRLAADWREKLAAGVAGALDPANIPSAVVGAVSPDMRDQWRSIQDAQPGMANAGKILAGLPIYSAVGAIPSTLGQMAAMAGLGAGSDVIDEASGKEGSVDKGTVLKAIGAQAGTAPMRYLTPQIAAYIANQVQFVPEAHAQDVQIVPPLSDTQQKRLDKLMRRRQLSDQEMVEKAKLEEQQRNAAASVIAYQRAQDEKNRLRAIGLEDAAKGKQDAVIDAANKRYNDVLNRFPRATRETEYEIPSWIPGIGGKTVDIGGTFSNVAPILPLLAAAWTGAKLGKTPDAAKLGAWNDAINTLKSPASTDAERAAADAISRQMSTEMRGRSMPASSDLIGRSIAASVLGGAEGAALANFPEIIDQMRLDKNPQRVALEEKLKLLPTGSKEYADTKALLRDYDAIPDQHPDKTRAKKHFSDWSSWAPRTITEGGAGAVTGGTTAFTKMMLPWMKTPPAVLEARELGARAMTPEAVREQAAKRAALADIDASTKVSGAKRGTDTDRGVDYYKSPKYGDRVTKSLEANHEDGLLPQPATNREVQPPVSQTSPQPAVSPIREAQTVYSGLREGPSTQPQLRLPEVSPNPTSGGPQPIPFKQSTAGYHYPAGHVEGDANVGGRFVLHEIVESNAAPAPKAKPKQLNADAPRSPAKRSPKAGDDKTRNKNELTAEDNLTDPSRLGRGMYTGGAVDKALALAGRYADGGSVHVGAVVGDTKGRSDKLPVSVPAGSFVVPADAVSALGEGNSLAGCKVLDRMFHGSGRPGMASGGQAVPIKISDGEYVIPPDAVSKIGRGDMDMGHRTLDKFVLGIRKQHINQLKTLPPPAR